MTHRRHPVPGTRELLRAMRIVEGVLGTAISSPLRLTTLTRAAQEAYHATWSETMPPGHPAAHWDWDLIAAETVGRPYRFGVAIWSGVNLCGLAAGRLTDSRRIARIDWMVRHPVAGAALKGLVLPVILAVAEEYGRLLGCSVLRLMHPLPELVPIYRDELGFAVVESGGRIAYCDREIRP